MNPTIVDVANRLDPEGKISAIAEILSQSNEILLDMPFIEGNDGAGHKSTIRTGLPEATWRKLNYGVQPSKSETAQIRDASGMLEAYAEVDKALADLNGNSSAFRLSEDLAFLQSMNHSFAQTLIYGDTTKNPERFMGIAPRYSDLSAKNKDNILDAGGTDGDNTSIYLVYWGEHSIHGFYPKGSTAGLQFRDLGEVTLEDAAKGKYQGYRTHYKWDAGLTVRDWRHVVRISNIKTSSLTKNASAGADLIDLMTEALERIPSGLGNPAFLCNRTISSFLRRQIVNKSNVNLSLEDVSGRKVVAFDGVPVRRVDAIVNSESRVV